VGTVAVVVDPPIVYQDLCFEERIELGAVEELVTQPAVEALDPGVLPRRPRVYEDRSGAVEAAPVGHRGGDELGSIIEAQIDRCASFGGDAFQGGHDPVGVDGAVHDDGRPFSGEFVVAYEARRIVHPEMQFHMISRPVGQPAPEGYNPGMGPSWGSLPVPERLALVDVLRPATTSPDHCWFCLWEGHGDLDDQGVAERVQLPGRDYLFYAGPVEMALESPPGLEAWDQAPNLWWPDDRAWCVATEIDYAWTYVGGTSRLIDRLLADERLEALPAHLTDQPFYDSDLLNAGLDIGSDHD
jgi:hypothetical protein